MRHIRNKLWLGMFSIILLMLILLWLFQIVFLQQFYVSMHKNQIISTGQSIIGEFANNEIALTDAFQDAVDRMANRYTAVVQLYDDKGELIYQSSGGDNLLPNVINKYANQISEMTNSSEEAVSLEITHPRFDTDYMLVALPISADLIGDGQNKLIGRLQISYSIAPVSDTVEVLKVQLLWITAIILLVTLLASGLMARGFTKPILEIDKVAKQIAEGHMDARVLVSGKDEIALLAQQINGMAKQLGKNESLRKEFIANVSHELRTPLSIIKGYAETLRDVTGANEVKREKQLTIIIDEVERLNELVNDILNLSRLEIEEGTGVTGSCNLVETMMTVITYFQVFTEKSNIEFKWNLELNGCHYTQIDDLANASLLIAGSEKQILQVLINLCANAFNHTPEGGQVSLLIKDNHDDNVLIEVKDSGEGISDEDMPYIWDRYYKSSRKSQGEKIGTGLGLAIVKTILSQHHAEFGVKSTINVGSVFWFILKKNNIKI